MLIVALVLAVIGLAALVTAVVTSNELVAWVCIAASVIGVILLIVDAIRERQNRRGAEADSAAVVADATESSATAETTAYSETDETVDSTYSTFDADYPDDPTSEVPVDEEPAPAAADEADEPENESEEKPSDESGSR
ncbi:phage holin family protein [Mycolicibacterium sphagni]|uniref:Phage holin family protein n=1 Tax=Mycolicibacterium sphagni TaxID=1786 RepID=A0ABX2K323_9MYCO|nr:phage holin family protein [Mycolicibacterium sphagni]NTY63597.1 phage holin family protein [Mycolicibacterium sphagni]